MGLNPIFHNEETVFNAITDNVELFDQRDVVTHVFFYGAGCSSETLREVISVGLSRVFGNALIAVDTDLMACALSTYDNEPSISCILGTGSNSCFFDGKEIRQAIPALGYILGDEGSGAYFGKKLLANYLYLQLPTDLHEALEKDMKLTKSEVLRRVYQESNANVYLASMMEFIFANQTHEYFQEMMLSGFKEFIGIHVVCYSDYANYKVHFVGSIAYLFRAQLAEACIFHGVTIGQVIKKPIDGLIRYHQINRVSE